MPLLFSWLILGSAILHVAEEFFLGWVAWANQFIKGVTRLQFLFWNTLFILLCAFGVYSGSQTFKLSLAGLLLCNVFVHLVPSIQQQRYSPGLVSALVLYLPLSVCAYAFVIRHALSNAPQILLSLALGAIWMSIPFLFQMIRVRQSRA